MTAVLSYESMVEQLVGLKVPREKAEARARELCGLPAPDPAAERDASILEKTEQLEVTKVFRGLGFTVRSLSQPRASKQSPGIPDLWVTHNTRAIAFWWETKRQVGGKFSDAQLTFRADCERCGVGYGAGDRHHAAEHLITLGIAVRDRGVLEPVRSLSHNP